MQEPGIIIEDGGNENWETYQPEADLIPLTQCLQIRFTKKAADAVNIYRRKPGDASWEFIATAVNSPFDDHEADELWEYSIRGVRDKREIGIPLMLSK